MDDITTEFVKTHDFGGPGNPGSPQNRSLWLCGIEYGESTNQRGTDEEISAYSVALQWRNWTYNRNAFKLIAAIEGHNIPDARDYALRQKIFESADAPYLQTNLLPIECRTLETWTAQAQSRSGFADKASYIEAIRAACFSTMHRKLLACRPRLFIGVGTTYKDDFCRVVHGESVELERHDFSINGHGKTLYLRRGDIPFALVPHLSSRNGLNSHAALSKAAELIRGIL